MVIVINHNKLHRIGGILVKKNKLISDQKDVLFSEVHHRVKNNLALVGAFLELDQMDTDNETAAHLLVTNKNRIKVIAQAQELAYQSQKLGTVPLSRLVGQIVGNYPGTELNFQGDGVETAMNVNQAQSYALLLNEFLAFITALEDGVAITLEVNREGEHVHTRLSFSHEAESKTLSRAIKERPVIRTQLAQLKADHRVKENREVAITFSFELKDLKGTAGNRHYPRHD